MPVGQHAASTYRAIGRVVRVRVPGWLGFAALPTGSGGAA
ncbi:MAG: hypothetical protein OJF49_001233 [Ktedonobacterales bacterium]|nr:MAG: hypothetical protein OJF49_001233 [Ktedonobacterales bacterium]